MIYHYHVPACSTIDMLTCISARYAGDESVVIETFNTLEQAELHAAMTGGDVYEFRTANHLGDGRKTQIYESSTGRQIHIRIGWL